MDDPSNHSKNLSEKFQEVIFLTNMKLFHAESSHIIEIFKLFMIEKRFIFKKKSAASSTAF